MSDPTGTLLSASYSGNVAVPVTLADMKIAPVFDVTGAVVSDPTGTLLNANMKIAPVFDTTGAVVSDPTGTILSVIH